MPVTNERMGPCHENLMKRKEKRKSRLEHKWVGWYSNKILPSLHTICWLTQWLVHKNICTIYLYYLTQASLKPIQKPILLSFSFNDRWWKLPKQYNSNRCVMFHVKQHFNVLCMKRTQSTRGTSTSLFFMFFFIFIHVGMGHTRFKSCSNCLHTVKWNRLAPWDSNRSQVKWYVDWPKYNIY